MAEKLLPFDMAAHLDSPEAIVEYLNQVLADGDTDELLRALGHIAKARADTLLKVIRAVGVQLHTDAA